MTPGWKGVSDLNIVEAILNLQFWQVVLVVILAVAGSSAASAFIAGRFESGRQSRTFRREVRREALNAIGQAYGQYLKYGNTNAPAVVDPTRDQEIAERTAAMHVAIAAIGDKKLLPLGQRFARLGESFASLDEAISVSAVNSEFTELIKEISLQIPER